MWVVFLSASSGRPRIPLVLLDFPRLHVVSYRPLRQLYLSRGLGPGLAGVGESSGSAIYEIPSQPSLPFVNTGQRKNERFIKV
jgi:hypothetical protein